MWTWGYKGLERHTCLFLCIRCNHDTLSPLLPQGCLLIKPNYMLYSIPYLQRGFETFRFSSSFRRLYTVQHSDRHTCCDVGNTMCCYRALCKVQCKGSPKALCSCLGSVAYRGVSLGDSNPPPPLKFRRPSKIVPNSPRLWKLLKSVEFRTPTPQDVRKKGSKILKLPTFAIVLQ